MASIDLSAAFDVVDVGLLLKKTKDYRTTKRHCQAHRNLAIVAIFYVEGGNQT